MSKEKAQPLEIADDESVEVYTNYDYDSPLQIENEDPSMRYFFAANDGDNSRPDGVARVKQLGYKVSEKKHGSTDCTLMEIPREIWERRERAKRQRRLESRRGLKSQIEDQAGESAVRLKKDGGYYRS